MKNTFLAFTLLFLVGCGEEAKTKNYYVKNLDEAKIKVQECKKAEKLNETQRLECQNANSTILNSGKNDWEGKSRPDIYKNF